MTTPSGAPPRGELPAGRIEAEANRYGTAMLRRFGWFYYALGLGRALDRVRLEEHSAEQIRQAAARGPIVYVLPRASTFDGLALNTVLNRRRLPLAVWSNGGTRFWWQPVADAWRELVRRARERLAGRVPEAVTSGWVARAVAGGAPVCVYLQRSPTLRERLGGDAPPDPLEALLEAQKHTDRPIQLLPAVVVWERGPERPYNAVQWFLGGPETPGFFTQIRRLLFQRGDAFVQVGEPLDLRELVERVDVTRRTRALHTVLRRWLHRESTLVRGPRLLPYRVMKRVVLDNPPMRELARRESEATGRPIERVRRQMERDYDRIAARFRWWIIEGLRLLLNPLWTKVFDGVDIRPDDLDRIRAAMRSGSAVLVPSHKSHFDYLLLSWVFYTHDLIVPHVVAGMNLAIWPISIVLRGAGGFFIKRSFHGERVFPAVFSRYLRELVRQGYPVEFFIEGGRTRSGKLLPPKLGVLGMVLDAAEHRRRGTDVTLLAMAFAYEEVAEAEAYARELGGEPKRPETVGQLVRARSVLRRRYGRVYLRVAEPIACSTIVDAAPGREAWSERAAPERREELQRVGERVVWRIGRVTVVLPTSLVALGLLAHHRRGIRHPELVARVERFRAFLLRQGALEAVSLANPSDAIGEALARFLREGLLAALDADGERVWSVHVEKRISLDFHKNQIVHFFAPAAYAAAAIRALPDAPFRRDDARPGFLFLAWTLRREFVLDPDRSATAQLDDALDALVAHGALTRAGDTFSVADPARMGEIYQLLRSLLEGYLAVLRVLPEIVARGATPEDLDKSVEAAMAALPGVSRPESLSAVTRQNVLASLREEGALAPDDRGTLRLAEASVTATRALLVAMVT